MRERIKINISEFKDKVLSGISEKELMSFYNCGRTKITKLKKDLGIYSPPRNSPVDGKKVCGICNKILSVEFFYSNGYYSSGIKKYKPYCFKCENDKAMEIYLEKIKKALNELGKDFCCEKCGYDRNSAAIEFHHLNKDYKISNISQMRTASFEVIKKELSKCLVLCANCHRETHNLDKMLQPRSSAG